MVKGVHVSTRPAPPLLCVRGLCAGYGNRAVLHDVSFDLAANHVWAIYGDNGAGKSTLLKAVAGLLPPTSGSVCLMDHAIAGLPPHDIQRLGVGYLPQGGRVFPNLTVGENIAIARRGARGDSLSTADVAGQLPGLAQRLPLGKRVGLLSSGERQILALEMILCQHPRLMLLDEPTAGMSPECSEEILRGIAHLAARQGCAVIIAEQNVEAVMRIATISLTLVNGAVSEISRIGPRR